MSGPPQSPSALDPPFRGYIETTFDSLLVFEAARRGMIPRVTRRLIERERGMVQSGAVFVFDEQESGIKRWTDGLVWSPSRILGNFLVYRETDKRPGNPPTPMTATPNTDSPPQASSSSTPLARPGQVASAPVPYAESSQMGSISNAGASGVPGALGQGELLRPRSESEGGGIDRQRERQLVGSLTSSYKFKGGGLVKKTMSVNVNGFAQHMISYYSVEDVLAGKLRTPSTVPELSALEISADYLHKQNFRFPPMIEVGQDGVPRYRGEPEEPTSPQTPVSGAPLPQYHPGETPYDFGNPHAAGAQPQGPPPPTFRLDSPTGRPHRRSVTVPMPIPTASQQYMPPGAAGSSYFESPMAPPIVRQGSSSSIQSASSGLRSTSSSRRYEPYGGVTSPRVAGMQMPLAQAQVQAQGSSDRRMSQSSIQEGFYRPPPSQPYDVKPFQYQPPSTAPGSFANFYAAGGPQPSPHLQPIPSPTFAPSSAPPGGQPYPHWHGTPAQTSRLLPNGGVGVGVQDYSQGPNPPSSAGSSGSGPHSQHGQGHVVTPGEWNGPPGMSMQPVQGWEQRQAGAGVTQLSPGPTSGEEWRAEPGSRVAGQMY